MWITEPIIRLKSYYKLTRELNGIKNTIVLVGNNKDAQMFDRFLKHNCNYWGIARFSESGSGKDYTSLISEEIDDYVVLFSDGDMTRNHEEKLIEIGFKPEQFRHHCFWGVGSRLDYYDYLVGYTKKSRNALPGYDFFPLSEHVKATEGCFTILTLGGSTTDPGVGNVISWSECLYNELKKYHDNIRIICAGVTSHVASQELLKLIRDGYLFSPDLVISYSGVNDFSDHYQDSKNPFVLRYTKRIIPLAARKRLFNEKDVIYDRVSYLDSLYWRIIVRDYSFGVDAPTPISRADHWVRCEKMMHAVSHSIGADFIGILQPQNFTDGNDPKVQMRNPNYIEAKQLLKNLSYDWLLDYTDIFKDEKYIFYDNCHVYGRGNKIIAKKILPHVLKIINKRTNEN